MEGRHQHGVPVGSDLRADLAQEQTPPGQRGVRVISKKKKVQEKNWREGLKKSVGVVLVLSLFAFFSGSGLYVHLVGSPADLSEPQHTCRDYHHLDKENTRSVPFDKEKEPFGRAVYTQVKRHPQHDYSLLRFSSSDHLLWDLSSQSTPTPTPAALQSQSPSVEWTPRRDLPAGKETEPLIFSSLRATHHHQKALVFFVPGHAGSLRQVHPLASTFYALLLERSMGAHLDGPLQTFRNNTKEKLLRQLIASQPDILSLLSRSLDPSARPESLLDSLRNILELHSSQHLRLPVDFYTFDFRGEMSAFHADVLRSQSDFVLDSLLTLTQDYLLEDDGQEKHIILVGHSMGGVIVRQTISLIDGHVDFLTGLLASHTERRTTKPRDPKVKEEIEERLEKMKKLQKAIQSVITLGSPHNNPPWPLDHSIVDFYNELNSRWSNLSRIPEKASNFSVDPTIIVSISGSFKDVQVITELSEMFMFDDPKRSLSPSQKPRFEHFYAVSTSVPDVWTSIGHTQLIRCGELMEKLSITLLSLLEVSFTNEDQFKANLETLLRVKKPVHEMRDKWALLMSKHLRWDFSSDLKHHRSVFDRLLHPKFGTYFSQPDPKHSINKFPLSLQEQSVSTIARENSVSRKAESLSVFRSDYSALSSESSSNLPEICLKPFSQSSIFEESLPTSTLRRSFCFDLRHWRKKDLTSFSLLSDLPQETISIDLFHQTLSFVDRKTPLQSLDNKTEPETRAQRKTVISSTIEPMSMPQDRSFSFSSTRRSMFSFSTEELNPFDFLILHLHPSQTTTASQDSRFKKPNYLIAQMTQRVPIEMDLGQGVFPQEGLLTLPKGHIEQHLRFPSIRSNSVPLMVTIVRQDADNLKGNNKETELFSPFVLQITKTHSGSEEKFLFFQPSPRDPFGGDTGFFPITFSFHQYSPLLEDPFLILWSDPRFSYNV